MKVLPKASLVIPHSWHLRMLERLVKNPHHSFLMRVGFARPTPEQEQWLGIELMSDLTPLAHQHPADKFVVVRPHSDEGTLPYFESQLGLLPTTVVGELFYGIGAWNGHSWGFVRTQSESRYQSLRELLLPGPGMEVISLQPGGSIVPVLSLNDEQRYSRTLTAWDAPDAFMRMRNTQFLIAGAGRTGLFMAEAFARMGAPFILCDPSPLVLADLGEISLICTDIDLNEAKSTLASRRLASLMPEDRAPRAVIARLNSPAGSAAARTSDVLIDCGDTDALRLCTALLATVYHKPQLSMSCSIQCLDEGKRIMGADIRLVLPGVGRCLRCMGGILDYERALRELAAPTLSDNEGGGQQDRVCSLRSLNQVATGLGQRLLEDLFQGRVHENRWLRLEVDDFGHFTLREPDHGPQQPNCPICRKAGEGDRSICF